MPLAFLSYLHLAISSGSYSKLISCYRKRQRIHSNMQLKEREKEKEKEKEKAVAMNKKEEKRESKGGEER